MSTEKKAVKEVAGLYLLDGTTSDLREGLDLSEGDGWEKNKVDEENLGIPLTYFRKKNIIIIASTTHMDRNTGGIPYFKAVEAIFNFEKKGVDVSNCHIIAPVQGLGIFESHITTCYQAPGENPIVFDSKTNNAEILLNAIANSLASVAKKAAHVIGGIFRTLVNPFYQTDVSIFKDIDFYLLPSIPTERVRYRNSYIMVGEKLYYVTAEQTLESINLDEGALNRHYYSEFIAEMTKKQGKTSFSFEKLKHLQRASTDFCNREQAKEIHAEKEFQQISAEQTHDVNFYLLTSIPPEGDERDRYKNNYILVKEKLYYVTAEKKLEPINLNGKNPEDYSSFIAEITKRQGTIFLPPEQLKNLRRASTDFNYREQPETVHYQTLGTQSVWDPTSCGFHFLANARVIANLIATNVKVTREALLAAANKNPALLIEAKNRLNTKKAEHLPDVNQNDLDREHARKQANTHYMTFLRKAWYDTFRPKIDDPQQTKTFAEYFLGWPKDSGTFEKTAHVLLLGWVLPLLSNLIKLPTQFLLKALAESFNFFRHQLYQSCPANIPLQYLRSIGLGLSQLGYGLFAGLYWVLDKVTNKAPLKEETIAPKKESGLEEGDFEEIEENSSLNDEEVVENINIENKENEDVVFLKEDLIPDTSKDNLRADRSSSIVSALKSLRYISTKQSELPEHENYEKDSDDEDVYGRDIMLDDSPLGKPYNPASNSSFGPIFTKVEEKENTSSDLTTQFLSRKNQ